MKKTFKYFICLTIFMCSILYFLFSFVKWNYNPANWPQDTRAFFSFISVGCMLISLLISVAYSEQENDKKRV